MLTWDEIDQIDPNFILPRAILRCAAVCPITGISLSFTHGRARRGSAPRFHVFVPEYYVSRYRPYKDWRYSSRAWTVDEAIQKALSNKRVQQWYADIWRREFNIMICD